MNEKSLPRHIAIIMDGNRRWAKKHKIKVALGHRRGVETLRTVVSECSRLGIEVLSLFAFSTENWARSKEEVGALMDLVLEFFTKEIDELDRENVRIRILGDISVLPQEHQIVLQQDQIRTLNNTGLQLNIALNYGGRAEIVRAAKEFARDVLNGGKTIDSLNELNFNDYLYTFDQPQVDLLIRTSGEKRISNFMLYQNAYAEFEFPDLLWPDFDKKALIDALDEYANRQRRFGGT